MTYSTLLCLSGLFCLTAASAQAQPLLQCEISYAGTTQIFKAQMQHDADSVYIHEATDIGGRFRFKAVLLGSGEQLDTIKIYAYYETRRQAVLLQEVKYSAPFARSAAPYGLTGLNYLYSPPLGRELQYGCALLESQ
ncbi:hypothetical protein AAKU67_002182 [Oxalobacteraceae bacterium GrIS 2.11]